MKFSIATAAALLVFASAAAATTVAEFEFSIKAVDECVVDLNDHLHVNSLNYFSGLAIQHSAHDLTAKIKAAKFCAEELTEKVSEAKAKAMLQELAFTETKVKAATTRLVALKGEFQKLKVAALAQGSIEGFQVETIGLGAALVKISPVSTKAAAKSLVAKFNADLSGCAASYRSETEGSIEYSGKGSTRGGAQKGASVTLGRAANDSSAVGSAGAESTADDCEDEGSDSHVTGGSLASSGHGVGSASSTAGYKVAAQ